MSITLNAIRSARRHTRSVGVVAAPLAALLVWLVAEPLAGIDLAAHAGGAIQDVGPVSVVIAALAAGLAAWGLRAILDRRGDRGRTIWTVTAVVVLLASLLTGPLGGVTMAAKIVLVCLHVVVGATLIAALAPPVTTE